MKYLLFFIAISLAIYSCDSTKSTMKGETNTSMTENDTVRIANDSLEYEILIIEPGFNSWLVTQQPRGYYGLNYLENKNNIYVTNWNMRALNPSRFDSSIYENVIEYNSQVNYGLEVNYKLFNYFQFAQQKYKMRLDGGTGPLGKIR